MVGFLTIARSIGCGFRYCYLVNRATALRSLACSLSRGDCFDLSNIVISSLTIARRSFFSCDARSKFLQTRHGIKYIPKGIPQPRGFSAFKARRRFLLASTGVTQNWVIDHGKFARRGERRERGGGRFYDYGSRRLYCAARQKAVTIKPLLSREHRGGNA